MKNIASSNGKYQIMAEINMVPFIDIALVLLIIFMVMTPFLIKSQIKINLPKANSTQNRAQTDDQIEVQVDRQGQIYIDGRNIPESILQITLKDRISDPESQPMVVEADKDVAFEHVVKVMSVAKELGLTKIGVNVRNEKRTAGI